jgi:ABC-type microcin C transport system permease subunit YejE
MESWRGRGRQAGRDALARLVTAWLLLLAAALYLITRVIGVLAGVAGAVVAVPIVAVITRAVPELRRRDPAPGGP